jgi:dienelactone hydrolase
MKVQGVVSFHGGLGRDAARVNNVIKARVLVLHGADDLYVPAAEVTAFQQEMRYESRLGNDYADLGSRFTDPEAGNDN